jgi:Domain of unknown function (DUF4277)
MAVAMQQISPVAHLPLVRGVVRKLNVAALSETFCPPHPAQVLSCGRGVEALRLAMLDGPQALSKVGARLEDRGLFPVLQPGLTRTALHEYRLGQLLDGLLAAHRHRVLGAIALKALEVYALSTPWLHPDTTALTLSGADAEEPHRGDGPVPPRPAYGHRTDGHEDLKPVLLRRGVSSDGLPLRLGVRDGPTRDRTEPPVAIEECLALGREGVRGIVADRQASCQRTRGLCLETQLGLITRGPRRCGVRQALARWGQQQAALPFWLDKPGRTRQEPPRRRQGQSVSRQVEVAYADGQLAVEALRVLVVHSSQFAPQAAVADNAAHATEAERVAEHVPRVEARWFAGAADAEAASSDDEGRGPGRRGRKLRLWRDHARHSRVEAVSAPVQRARRGRPPKAEAPQVAVRSRLVVHPEALVPAEATHGWTVLATTVRPEVCTDAERLQAYQEQRITVEPGFRWSKNPAAISPVWRETPERIAA